MSILDKFPWLSESFEVLCRTRRDEILQYMVERDELYYALRLERTKTSMLLKGALGDKDNLLEEYANAVYTQECYELDKLYRQGFLDALIILEERGLL